MARKKPADALKAKERKQKIFVVIGFVILIAAGAYEVPMLMGGKSAPPPEATATTPQAVPTTGTTSLAPPTPGTAAPAPIAGVGALVDTDLMPQATQTSLIAFSLFSSKDPFVQQISPTVAGAATVSGSAADPSTGNTAGPATPASGSGTPTGSTGSGSTGSATTGSGSVVPGSSGGSTGSTGGATQTGDTVTLSVNGKQEAVGKGGTFPASAPTFRLISFGKSTAQIGIVGGSYASGGQSVTLKQGVPLTLVNTSDDTRYRIVLIRTP